MSQISDVINTGRKLHHDNKEGWTNLNVIIWAIICTTNLNFSSHHLSVTRVSEVFPDGRSRRPMRPCFPSELRTFLQNLWRNLHKRTVQN